MVQLPPRTDVPNLTPNTPLTQESYFGYDYPGNGPQNSLDGQTASLGVATKYSSPPFEYPYSVERAGTSTIGPRR